MAIDGYEYYAFISYNSQDEKWARRIHRWLLGYRLPSVARCELGSDYRKVRISPVFRYVTNMSLGDLREEIDSNLEKSKFLIVVCSPHSAKPNMFGKHWVNGEVRRFIEMGRKDRIIPVIVDGVPNSGDEETECFPPALREESGIELTAADLVHGTREQRRCAFIKLVAKLLEIVPKTLLDYEKEEKARQRRLWWMRQLPLAFVVLLLAFFAWDCLFTHSKYYADYVDCYGLPEGIFEVQHAEVGQRCNTYRFDYCGYYWRGIHEKALPKGIFGYRRKLRRVVCVGPRDVPQADVGAFASVRPIIQEFEYDHSDDQRRLAKVRVRKRGGSDFVHGPIERIIHYATPKRAKTINGMRWETQEDETQLRYADSSQTQAAAVAPQTTIASRIFRFSITRNEDGREVKEMFLPLGNGSGPIADSNGVYGKEYELRADGRVNREIFLNADGERAIDRLGVCAIAYEYDSAVVTKIEHEDLGGNPIIGRAGYVTTEMRYDGHGNLLEKEVRSADRKLAYRRVREQDKISEFGGTYRWARVRAEYSNGLMVVRRAFDPSGAPLSARGEIAVMRCSYNELGDLTRRDYFDAAERPTISTDGYASMRFDVDEETGLCTNYVYYAEDGKTPTYGSDGFASSRIGYDPATLGFARMEFRGAGGELVCNRNGIAVKETAYEGGHIVRESFSDAFCNPRAPNDYGGSAAVTTYEYDEYGNLKKGRFFADFECKVPTVNAAGEYGFVCEFDDRGRQTLRWGLDINGDQRKRSDGVFAGWRKEYRELHADEKVVDGHFARAGWREELTTYYRDETTKNSYNGFCSTRDYYDEKGNLVIRSVLDEGGNPVNLVDEGYATAVMPFNGIGQQVAALYFGADGKPTRNAKTGVGGMKFEYHPTFGQVKSQTYLDIDHLTPICFTNETNSSICNEYRADGSLEMTSYWHLGNRVRLKNGGYHCCKIRQNIFGDRLEEEYFDENEQACDYVMPDGFSFHRAICEISATRQQLYAARYDRDNHLLQMGSDGFCAKSFEYDSQRRKIAEYLIAKPADDSVKTPTYAEYPGCNRHGVSRMIWRYHGNTTIVREQEEMAIDGEAGLYANTNVARAVFTYDTMGRKVYEAYFGKDNKAVGNNSGMATTAWQYDAFSGRVSQMVMQATGKGGIWGYEWLYRVVRKYDAEGKELPDEYFDCEGNLVDRDGVRK